MIIWWEKNVVIDQELVMCHIWNMSPRANQNDEKHTLNIGGDLLNLSDIFGQNNFFFLLSFDI